MSSIHIDNSADCSGCSACAAVCPVDCIAMRPDAEGFAVPQVDAALCTDCGQCVEVCPWKKKPTLCGTISPPDVFAAWHLDDAVRRKSSSGGVFSALAEDILTRGGIVAGAAFDAAMVCRHILIEDTVGVERLRGSKYVQSEIASQVYRQIEKALKEQRPILFSGTPCQVAGLRNFLGKDYDSLFCCDIVCHGVPSPMFFNKHMEELQANGNTIKNFHFRDKRLGWKRFEIQIKWTTGKPSNVSLFGDAYMAAYLKDCGLRESCYTCKFMTTDRQGDLTIADFWKVGQKYPEYDKDDKGTSLILVNTGKGRSWLEGCRSSLFLGEADLAQAIAGNPMLQRPARRPKSREQFYQDMQTMSIRQLRRKYRLHSQPLWRKFLGRIKRMLIQCGCHTSIISKKTT